MAVQVKCYKYNDDPRVIDKSPTFVKSIECRVVDPFDVVDPTLLVDATDDISECNYFTVESRKYFKAGLVKTANKMNRLKLHEDILSTWMPRVWVVGTITNASQIISEDVDQGYLTDVNRKISRIRISNGYEELSDDPIIIIQCPLPTITKPST